MRLHLLAFATCLILGSCTKKENVPELPDIPQSAIRAENLQVDTHGMSHAKAVLKTTHGDIVFKFYPEQATNTVTRIMQLIQSGFYNGLTFHRVIPNFVIQGGDPAGNGTGGSGVKLKAEFNSIQHIKGTVAMARAADVNSADSQFYMALSTLPHLDQKYTVFGQVVEGESLLSKVAKGDKILSMTLRNIKTKE